MTDDHDDSHPRVFFDLHPEVADPEHAAAAILPVPYEATASWLKGTASGPQAILEASQYVEVWDLETASEPWRHGIATLEPVSLEGPVAGDLDPGTMVERVETRVGELLDRDQLPVVLGGEHSVTIGAIRAAAKRFENLSVLQIDAHADTRETYHGSPYSHACVMARARELCPIVQVGIRSADSDEIPRLDPERVFWAHDIRRDREARWVERAVDLCTQDVYVTIDVDGFDPSQIPSTGTPEPGGLDWYQVNDLLSAVARGRRVVAFDVVELIGGHAPSAFTSAKLVYRFLAEIFSARVSEVEPRSLDPG